MKATNSTFTQDLTTTSNHSTSTGSDLYCLIPQRVGQSLSMTWVKDFDGNLIAFWS